MMPDLVTATAWIAVAMLAAAALLGLLRLVRAPEEASRAVVGDLVYFCAISILMVVGTITGSSAMVDAALLASVLGILATLALARILTRGRR